MVGLLRYQPPKLAFLNDYLLDENHHTFIISKCRSAAMLLFMILFQVNFKLTKRSPPPAMFYERQGCQENHRCTIFFNNIRSISFNIYKMFLCLKKLLICYLWDFPAGSVVKNLPAKAGDTRDRGWIPGLGRCPEEGNDTLLKHSCLGNSTDRRACWATVHGVAKSWYD